MVSFVIRRRSCSGGPIERQRDSIVSPTTPMAPLLLNSKSRADSLEAQEKPDGCRSWDDRMVRDMQIGSLRRWQKGGAELLAFVCVLFFCVPALLGQESYREFEQGLNLSDSQRAQVEGIKRKYMDEWTALKDESTRKRLELRELREDRPEDREKSQRLQRDLDQLDASRHRLFRRYTGEVSGVFNEQQRGRFNRFMDRENRRPVNPPRYRFHGR
jgi:hypothetical protein